MYRKSKPPFESFGNYGLELVARIYEGGNNKAFKAMLNGSDPVFVKQYAAAADSTPDRLKREYNALKFLEQYKVVSVSTPKILLVVVDFAI